MEPKSEKNYLQIMARCREYIQNVTTITKVVRISDNGKASQIPFTPIMAGNAMKHGTRKTSPRKTAKCDGRLYLFHALIISDNGEVQNKEDEPRAIIRESFYRYACGSIVNAQE